jgi:DNA mismatch endonuclease Vsr
MDDSPATWSGRPKFADVSPSRSRNMRAIRGKNTKPEMAVRRLLHAKGYRYRLHRRDLPGKPDLVFPARRKIIEVRGCFWHRHPGCRCASVPATRKEYWQTQFATNVARDERNLTALRAAGWLVHVIWECEVTHPSLALRLIGFLGPPGRQTRSSKA